MDGLVTLANRDLVLIKDTFLASGGDKQTFVFVIDEIQPSVTVDVC